MLIADEVMAGFGRCGEWFAVDHWGVTPDLITFAKGVNSGYVPLGGVIISDRDRGDRSRERPYPGGLTYSGHPLACASAVASINIFKDEGIVEHARDAGHRRHRARSCRSWPPGIRASARFAASACSGRSNWSATARRASRSCRSTPPARTAAPMNEFAAACKERGLWPFTHFNRTHVVPPCTTSADEVREGIAILDEALEVADRYYTGADGVAGSSRSSARSRRPRISVSARRTAGTGVRPRLSAAARSRMCTRTSATTCCSTSWRSQDLDRLVVDDAAGQVGHERAGDAEHPVAGAASSIGLRISMLMNRRGPCRRRDLGPTPSAASRWLVACGDVRIAGAMRGSVAGVT